jgi:membrane glycosyltransferase
MKTREATFDEVQRPLATSRQVSWRLAAGLRRALLTILVLAQSLVASSYMMAILPYHGGNMVEKAIIALFFVLFVWISVGFWIGMFGFILRCFGGDRFSPLGRHTAAELNK